MRVAQALTCMQTRPWPYAGRIGVREHAPVSECCELHVLDRWCYLGTVKTEVELHEFTATPRQPAFDLDTYKILARFFKSLRRNREIVPIGERLAYAPVMDAG